MNKSKKVYWCRYCRIWIEHNKSEDGSGMICSNCDRQTPNGAFERHQTRRVRYESNNSNDKQDGIWRK